MLLNKEHFSPSWYTAPCVIGSLGFAQVHPYFSWGVWRWNW